MKTYILSITILFFSILNIQAQVSLPDSPKKSTESYIYTINKDNLRKINLKNESISENMLKMQIAKYEKGKYFPSLRRGNYIIVEAVGNQLSFTNYVVDDLYSKIVPAEKMMLCLHDSLGNIITDAIVKCGSKKLTFDKQSQTYNTSKVKDEQIIEINNKGVYHYIEIEKQDSHYYRYKSNIFKTTWRKTKGLWYNMKSGVHYIFNAKDKPTRNKYTGFIVFNKPKFKPNEIVKLKAYMAEYKGKPYNKPVDLQLYSYYPHKIDTILAKDLTPYRPGMYEYQFRLTDSLNLKLDSHYTIALKTKSKRDNEINDRFKYEDYELKSIRFMVTTDKTEYAKSDPINVKLQVSDENEMALYGGRAEIYVIPQMIDKQKNNETLFIPDTLWRNTIDMNDISEKTVTLPDSIFPVGASLHYSINCTYLSADNEKKTESKTLYWKANDYLINFSLSKGMLTIKQIHKGKSQNIEAEVSIQGKNNENLFWGSVTLPHTMPIPWYASNVTIKTKDTKSFYSFDDVEKAEQIECKFYRQNDSVYIKVDNPAQIPFWYTVRKGKQEIASGRCTSSLNYSIRDKGKEGYNMQLSYLFGESNKRIEQSLPYAEKNITLDVSTPTTIYPGQKAKILVSVVDQKQNPVKDVDITAYSFTSKFDNYTMPPIPIKGKASYAKSYKNIKYTSDDASFVNSKGEMTWEKWKNTMALDTIEYYKLLYPETFYKYTEKTSDGSTQITPYVVIDGALQGIHMLWIDDKLYYTNLTQQMDIYAFQINSGKHNLRIRTYDREILVYDIIVEEGAKSIISFNAGKTYTRINSENGLAPFVLTSRLLDKKERGILSDKDVNYLSSQLITIDNNFGRLELPNVNTTFDLPAYAHSGNTIYYLNHTKRNSYNHTLGTFVNSPILAGPFPTRSFMNGISNIASIYADNNLLGNIELEGENKYTLYNQYQKIKSWDNLPFNKKLSKYTPTPNFKQELLTSKMIDQYFDKMLKRSLTTLTGSAIITSRKDIFENNSRLTLFLGKDRKGTDIKPSLIFIIPENKEEIANYKLYYGGTRNFKNLPQGRVKINLVVNDSISYSQNVVLRPNGENYLSIDSIEYEKNNELARHAFKLLNRNIKKNFTQNPYINQSIQKDSIVYVKSDYSSYSNNNAQKGIATGTVTDTTGEPLIGVSIIVEGTKNGTVTNLDGQFELTAKQGDKIQITYIGYLPKQIKHSEGVSYKIVLEDDSNALQEIVVVAYGVQKRSNLTGSITTIVNNPFGYFDTQALLQGKIAGVMVRGANSVQNSEPPLIIVNGLPFNGKLEDLDTASITSMNILKDASATSIYGARAANGVIMIQTNALFSVKPTDSDTGSESVEGGNSMRRNFHDDAFWQPRLKTNEKGEASFDVTYPDDITSWNAYFIAIGNKEQTDKKQMTIKSFKALTARLSMPQFAIRGDNLNAVGRIANHLGDSININRKIEINGQVQIDSMRLGSSFIDHIPVKAEKSDSLSITYSLQMQNGYFDGEERSIPILEQGMLQTYGDFKVIDDSETYQLKVDPLLGTTTIYAEVSSLDLFLREIDKVDKYPYMCNEQMGSKIKVLLSKKQIAKIFNKEFKDDKKINNLISRLNKNKNTEGLWGWWNRDKTEFWISKQIVSAMLDAEDAGYKTNFDKYTLSIAFEQELKNALSELKLVDKTQVQFAKQELLDRLVYLKRMNAPIDYHAYFKSIDSQLKSNTITDKLKTIHVMSIVGLQEEISVDSLMNEAKKTILGSIYWGDKMEHSDFFRIPFSPYENNIENTLVAYNILKNIGGHENKLAQIRNYFFENRHNGSWQNTYQSSRIIETIMPDMLKSGDSFNEVSMYINGGKINKFPYSEDIKTIEPIEIRKEGTLPLFITAYQQAWNKQPDSETKKGFSVKSYFVANKDSISDLTAGKTAQLEVLVNVDADANYVQIEIPIPAGCSYESKLRGSFWNEVHREYFKEKVVIFSNKLKKGKHKFSINLIARYSGKYHLNPTKVELMYFPTFYGNEELKIVDIQ